MKHSESYTDGFFAVSGQHGFLPVQDPLPVLPEKYADLQKVLDAMPVVLPDGQPGLLHTEGAILQAVDRLGDHFDAVQAETEIAVQQALFRSYGFLTSAYLLEPSFQQFRKDGTYGKARRHLPAHIARPFCEVSDRLGVFPWLDYHYAYSLGNYRRINPRGELDWENLTMCNRFSGQADEVGFIMLHVDINRFSAPLVGSILGTLDAASKGNIPWHPFLEANLNAMKKVNARRKEMWKASRWQHYNDFRVFIMGVKGNHEIFGDGVFYEGVWDEPKAFRGQTGAQDDIIPMQDIFTGLVRHYPENDLTRYLLDLRLYRPLCVRQFLDDLSETMAGLHPKGLPGWLKDQKDADSLGFLLGILEEIYHFRNGHWQFVQKYIMSNTRYSQATGGTPITSWIPNQLSAVLNQMAEVIDFSEQVGPCRLESTQLLTERNRNLLDTKKKLLEGQLALLHRGDFTPDSVYALNQEFGYADTE